jgi:hypothetical protein
MHVRRISRCIYSVRYHPRFDVNAVGLGTYYPWIRGQYCIYMYMGYTVAQLVETLCYKAEVREFDYHFHVPIVLKSGSINFLVPLGLVEECNGIALPLLYMYMYIYIYNA